VSRWWLVERRLRDVPLRRVITPPDCRKARSSVRRRAHLVIDLREVDPRSWLRLASAAAGERQRAEVVTVVGSEMAPIDAMLEFLRDLKRASPVSIDLVLPLVSTNTPGSLECSIKFADGALQGSLADSVVAAIRVTSETQLLDLEELLFRLSDSGVHTLFSFGDLPTLSEESSVRLVKLLRYLTISYEVDAGIRYDYESVRQRLTAAESAPVETICSSVGPSSWRLARAQLSISMSGNAPTASANSLRRLPIGVVLDSMLDHIGHASPGGFRHGIAEPQTAGIARVQKLARDSFRVSRTAKRFLCRPGVSHAHVGLTHPDVLLLGWYGTETTGDRAILGGIIDQVREVDPSLVIAVASYDRFLTEETVVQLGESGRGVQVVTLQEARGLVRFGHLRFVAIAGGPLMDLGALSDLVDIFVLATQAGIPRLILGCGVEALESRWSKRQVGRLLSASSAILVRDSRSAKMARLLGAQVPVQQVLDPAFLWLDAWRRRSNIMPAPLGHWLLAARQWPARQFGAKLSHADRSDLARRAHLQLLQIAAAFPMPLKPLAMNSYAVGGDDRFYLRRLFQGRDEMSTFSWDHLTLNQTAASVGSSSGVVAMRFHSNVFALALGRPVIPIDYTRGGKIAALYSDLAPDVPVLSLGEEGRLNEALAYWKRPVMPGTPKVTIAVERTKELIHAAIASALAEHPRRTAR
jgi:polysaccharide pyruvyl transferase WcaK-like protein